MTGIDEYVDELAASLRARGFARRRFLRECRDHLSDAADARGETGALLAFGPAGEVAAAFDAEVASRRGVRTTFTSVVAVLATGGSTLALIHASSRHTTAPTVWGICFFVAAQLAAVAAALALVQALVQRRSPARPGEVLLLCRRNGCALAAAALTMFSAGAALPGHGSALALLAGPVLVCLSILGVVRSWRHARRLEHPDTALYRPPLEDLGRLTALPLPRLSARRLLILTTAVASICAFLRDRGEHAALGQALMTAGIEAAAVVACFLLLGRALGIRPRRDGDACVEV